jgi:hypothetical protein
MQWVSKKQSGPNHGDKRIVQRFPIFPLSLPEIKNPQGDDVYFTHWLELVFIEQRFYRGVLSGNTCWEDIRYATEAEYDAYQQEQRDAARQIARAMIDWWDGRRTG